MKIVIDKAIPFISGVFEPYAETLYLNGPKITREDLLDAEALITRSRTRCDSDLLDGTAVKIIATATIGTGHIDMPYCDSRGIFVKTSSGSNAGGVMNYVFSALYGVAARKSIPLTGATFGVVGAGNVGSRVATMARTLGFKVLVHDPYRNGSDLSSVCHCSLDTLLAESDIVTLHVQLSENTRGMVDASFFEKMKDGAIFINTAHGDLIVEDDLIDALPKLGAVIIDTWSGEPDINLTLVEEADIATPHIAGYSYQGKQLATMMAVRSVARFFGFEALYDFFPEAEVDGLAAVKLDFHDKSQGEIASMMQYNYPVFTDDFIFRINPGDFNGMRENYRLRREFYTD